MLLDNQNENNCQRPFNFNDLKIHKKQRPDLEKTLLNEIDHLLNRVSQFEDTIDYENIEDLEICARILADNIKTRKYIN